MSTTEITVRGQITPEGTLELDGKPGLPAGPVQVVIRPMATPESLPGDWWQFLQRARAELEAAGHPFRSKEEIDAEIADLRSDDDIDDTACGPDLLRPREG